MTGNVRYNNSQMRGMLVFLSDLVIDMVRVGRIDDYVVKLSINHMISRCIDRKSAAFQAFEYEQEQLRRAVFASTGREVPKAAPRLVKQQPHRSKSKHPKAVLLPWLKHLVLGEGEGHIDERVGAFVAALMTVRDKSPAELEPDAVKARVLPTLPLHTKLTKRIYAYTSLYDVTLDAHPLCVPSNKRGKNHKKNTLHNERLRDGLDAKILTNIQAYRSYTSACLKWWNKAKYYEMKASKVEDIISVDGYQASILPVLRAVNENPSATHQRFSLVESRKFHDGAAGTDDQNVFSSKEHYVETFSDLVEMLSVLQGLAPVPSVTPTEYTTHIRNKKLSTDQRTWMALDVDGTTTIDAAKEHLRDFTYALWTTKSHTEASHRFRILFPLSQAVTASQYTHIAKVFAQSVFEFDTASYSPFQLMELPNQGVEIEYVEGMEMPVDVFLSETLNCCPGAQKTPGNVRKEPPSRSMKLDAIDVTCLTATQQWWKGQDSWHHSLVGLAAYIKDACLKYLADDSDHLVVSVMDNFLHAYAHGFEWTHQNLEDAVASASG